MDIPTARDNKGEKYHFNKATSDYMPDLVRLTVKFNNVFAIKSSDS
jgi:hypothetical protein